MEDLDLLVFGSRRDAEATTFPRFSRTLLGGRLVPSEPGIADGVPAPFALEAELGAPPLPAPFSERPQNVANLAEVPEVVTSRRLVGSRVRQLGPAAGSVAAGLRHSLVEDGKLAVPQHCHSAEEEIYVVLDGEAMLLLDEEATPLRPGHVVVRPPGTGVSHGIRGVAGLELLTFGTREPNDIACLYRSRKILVRGVGVIGRIEHLDYWDGED